jgi:hypothetical protein
MLPFNADICKFAHLARHKCVTCHMTDSIIFGYRDGQVLDQDGDTMSGSQRLSKRDRQQRILAELRVSATLRISELATELGVSYETIRRDLARWAKAD